MTLDLFADSGEAPPPTALDRCPSCGKKYGACDQRPGYFNHPTGFRCDCGESAITCQWCILIKNPPCTPQLHQHATERAEARRRTA